MRDQPESPAKVDPDPITATLAILGATAAVVNIIDAIRKAYREAEQDERDFRTRSLRDQKIGLQRLDAQLARVSDELKTLRAMMEGAERIQGRFLLSQNDFEHYRLLVESLIKRIHPIFVAVHDLEPTLEPGDFSSLGIIRDPMTEELLFALMRREDDFNQASRYLLDMIGRARTSISEVLRDPLVVQL